MRHLRFLLLLLIGAISGCQQDDATTTTKVFKYLALGDSYTIGESVAFEKNFPSQLKDSLQKSITQSRVDLKIIATTGWTTTNLIDEINDEVFPSNYDLVTLLIGVNNQYQQKPFSLYQTEFPQLVNEAIARAGGDKSRVIVVSIPDYAYTPYGQFTGNGTTISTQLSLYNSFAEQYCQTNDVGFVYITDITQQGLSDTELVAFDGLHPSAKAYKKFVERLVPLAREIVE